MSEIDILGLYMGILERAVRWEGLQMYRVPWEEDQIAAWREGQPMPANAEVDASLATIRQITGSGRHIIRIRGVRRPVSEYLQYERQVAYPLNSAAGEEIYIVDLDKYPEFDGVDDFVVFDDHQAVWYRYDQDGRPLGYDLTGRPSEVADRVHMRDRLLRAAVPLAEFLEAA